MVMFCKFNRVVKLVVFCFCVSLLTADFGVCFQQVYRHTWMIGNPDMAEAGQSIESSNPRRRVGRRVGVGRRSGWST